VLVLAQWAKQSAVNQLHPAEWDCPRCGFPAGRDKNKPPMPLKNEPYKTHLAYVKERRTEAEANKILDIALKKLRGED